MLHKNGGAVPPMSGLHKHHCRGPKNPNLRGLQPHSYTQKNRKPQMNLLSSPVNFPNILASIVINQQCILSTIMSSMNTMFANIYVLCKIYLMVITGLIIENSMIIIVIQNDIQYHLIINQQKIGATAHVGCLPPPCGAAQ